MIDSADTPLRHTPLYHQHVAANARLVDFAGWAMPIHYGSQIDEHHCVRQCAGVFDVSHMLVVDLHGSATQTFLRTLLANDVTRLTRPGQALYSCMLNATGGVLDDLIVYRLDEQFFRLVVNAGTAEQDVAWMRQQIDRQAANVTLEARRDLAILALQGPEALTRAASALPHLQAADGWPAPFTACQYGDFFIARTGYTGEDGLEIALPASQAVCLWQSLLDAGFRPCGLGARDTLRLEAGLNLYGQDMDGNTSPYAAGLGWTVDLRDPERDFIGKAALQNQPATQRLFGLVLEDRGVLRPHMVVTTPHGEGLITSGTYAPTLARSIAMARLPAECAVGDTVTVEIRGKALTARIVKLPFVRKGQILV